MYITTFLDSLTLSFGMYISSNYYYVHKKIMYIFKIYVHYPLFLINKDLVLPTINFYIMYITDKFLLD